MYLVIGPRTDKGYWVRMVEYRSELESDLDNGAYKDYYEKEDLIFVEELPKSIDRCARLEDFRPNEVLIVEVRKVIVPTPVKVTTQYILED